MKTTPPTGDAWHARAHKLGLWGLLAHAAELGDPALPAQLVDWEEEERQRRSLERRIQRAQLGRFKLMTDYDWQWPRKIDRPLVEDLFTFQFLEEAANVVLVGPNGVGKTMIAKNLAYQALLAGHTVQVVTAAKLLNELAAEDSASALERRLRRYCRPTLLVVDEVGYLSYGHRHADLLFELVNRRYQHKPIVLTTNRPFSEWNEVFPSAACVVTLIDRLLHRAEIVHIEAEESYRFKEARERGEARRQTKRAAKMTKKH